MTGFADSILRPSLEPSNLILDASSCGKLSQVEVEDSVYTSRCSRLSEAPEFWFAAFQAPEVLESIAQGNPAGRPESLRVEKSYPPELCKLSRILAAPLPISKKEHPNTSAFPRTTGSGSSCLRDSI